MVYMFVSFSSQSVWQFVSFLFLKTADSLRLFLCFWVVIATHAIHLCMNVTAVRFLLSCNLCVDLLGFTIGHRGFRSGQVSIRTWFTCLYLFQVNLFDNPYPTFFKTVDAYASRRFFLMALQLAAVCSCIQRRSPSWVNTSVVTQNTWSE